MCKKLALSGKIILNIRLLIKNLKSSYKEAKVYIIVELKKNLTVYIFSTFALK